MIKISDIENQRAQAGVTIKTPVYTSRVADANAARQEMQRAQSLQQQGTPTQTYIDPKTGLDTRGGQTQSYTPVYEGVTDKTGPMGNGTIAYYQPNVSPTSPGTLSTITPTGPITTRTAGGAAASQNLANIASGAEYNAVQSGTRTGPSYADVMDQATIGAQGLRTNFNQRTGNIQSDNTRVNTGQIDEAARERLIAAGMTPEEATAKIQQNRVAVQSAFGQVGTNSADGLQSAYDAIDQKYREAAGRGESVDPAVIAAEKTAAAAKFTAENEAADLKRRQEQESTIIPQDGAVPGTGSGAIDQPAPMDPSAAGFGAAFANLPPEAQFLAPFLTQFQQSIQQSMAENASLTEGMLGQVEKTYGGIQTELDTMKQGYIDSTEAMNGLLEEVRANNEETIAKQRKAEEDRLAWEKYKGRSTLQKQKRESHDAMVAQIALAGGFGQDAGLRAVMESDAEYESKMADLAIQFTYARTDLAAKFTGLYNENQNNYISKTLENTKELISSLERIGMQGIANQTAKQQAEQGIMEKAWNNQVSLRNTLATQNLNVAGQIAGMITEQRSEKNQKEQAAWGRLEWALDTYGSDIPSGLVDAIKADLPPSTDINSVLSAMTLEEVKARKSGGGGGGGLSGFSSYMMQGDGTIPPTFENFLIEKEKESFARGDVQFDRSAAAMAGYKKEYDARNSVQNKLNPVEITNRFAMKAGLLSGPARKYAESQLKQYLDAGQYQLASDFVSNTGDDIAATQENDFIQALNSRYNIQKMEGLFNEIGTTYPGIGTIRELNPLDDRVVQYKQNLTQTIPALARGVFKEVGVLTDSDIERYTSSVANPNLTVEQAANAFNDLKERINVSMLNQINVWDANGKRTKGLKDLYESAPIGSANTAAGYTPQDEEFANSILLGQ